jgi:uncharacterized membrane protein YhaH (DUF805 family)
LPGQPSLLWMFLSLTGRISRAPYLLGVLLILVIQLFFLYRVVMSAPGMSLEENLARIMAGAPATPTQQFWMESFSLVGLATAFPMAAITVKRLHDLGRTGWIALVAFLPFLNLLSIVLLSALPGTVGPNRYGSVPNASR